MQKKHHHWAHVFIWLRHANWIVGVQVTSNISIGLKICVAPTSSSCFLYGSNRWARSLDHKHFIIWNNDNVAWTGDEMLVIRHQGRRSKLQEKVGNVSFIAEFYYRIVTFITHVYRFTHNQLLWISQFNGQRAISSCSVHGAQTDIYSVRFWSILQTG